MLSEGRHQIVLDLLDTQGAVSVNELVARFDVSEMTIRRDLDLLERKGLLRRVHGGAVIDRGRSYEPPFLSRIAINQDVKRRIGKVAAEMVEYGDSITIDVGTTTLEMARFLTDRQNLTIITPCMHIANLLAESPDIRLILTGGIVRLGELSMTGHLAERVAREFFVDKLFLGASCVDFEAGLTEFNVEDTLVKQAMVKSAKEIILLADSSKFGQVAFASIAPLKVVHRIISDQALDPETVTRLKQANIEVILV